MPRDRRFVQITHKGDSKFYKQSRLNNHLLINCSVNTMLQERIEVETQKNGCKVFDTISPIPSDSVMRTTRGINRQSNLTQWLIDAGSVHSLLASNKCLAVVDGLFFPNHPEFISAHWLFAYDRKVIGRSGFVAKVQTHLQPAYASEVCGGVGVLTSVKQIMMDGDSLRKVDLMLGSDC